MKRAVTLADDVPDAELPVGVEVYAPRTIVGATEAVVTPLPRPPKGGSTAVQGLPAGYHYVPYPKWLYKADGSSACVGDAREEQALLRTGEWYDHPYAGSTQESAPTAPERHAWHKVGRGQWACMQCDKRVWAETVSKQFDSEHCQPKRA